MSRCAVFSDVAASWNASSAAAHRADWNGKGISVEKVRAGAFGEVRVMDRDGVLSATSRGRTPPLAGS
jgi:hypothetical protein